MSVWTVQNRDEKGNINEAKGQEGDKSHSAQCGYYREEIAMEILEGSGQEDENEPTGSRPKDPR